MKHPHETYLERRLALIDEEIEEANRQTVVSLAQVGELRRRRLHLVGELSVLRDRRQSRSLQYAMSEYSLNDR